MTSIRNFCCNDFLDVTSMVMDQITRFDKSGVGSSPLSVYLQQIAELPNYFLVAVTPGNRIKAYGTAFIAGNNTQKHCEIGEMNCPTADVIEMFIKIIEERADKIDKVYYLEIWMPTTASQESINFLEQVLQFSGKTCLKTEHITSLVQQKPQQSEASKTGLSVVVPPSISQLNEICDNDTHTCYNSDNYNNS